VTGALLFVLGILVAMTLFALAVRKWPGTRAAQVADRIAHRLARSYPWALLLAVNAADTLSRVGDVTGWHRFERTVAAVIWAKWAHNVWHRAEAWRLADRAVRR
jgi:hypothetical protein